MRRDDIHKPITGLLVTATLALALVNHQLGDDLRHDQFSAGIITVSFGIAALVILVFTERWSWRAVGVMIAMAGTSTVYGLILARSLGLMASDQLVTRSILRASLDVGGVLLLIGLVMWALERWRGDRIALFDWIDPRDGYRDGDR